MTYTFKFRTTYEFDEGLHESASVHDQRDPTEYYAHLVDDHYRIVVERGNYEAYVELPLRDVFDKVVSGEWIVLKK